MLLSLNTGFWHSQEVEDEQGSRDVCQEEADLSNLPTPAQGKGRLELPHARVTLCSTNAWLYF